jgi:hypothetical protein
LRAKSAGTRQNPKTKIKTFLRMKTKGASFEGDPRLPLVGGGAESVS